MFFDELMRFPVWCAISRPDRRHSHRQNCRSRAFEGPFVLLGWLHPGGHARNERLEDRDAAASFEREL